MSVGLLAVAGGALVWCYVAPSDTAVWLAKVAFGAGVAVAFLPLIALAAMLAYTRVTRRRAPRGDRDRRE
jgi:membrane protein implicated in regulation of membrane protease activity